MKNKLDFSLLPTISHGRVFLRLDDDVLQGIVPLRRVRERVINAVRFLQWSMGSSKVLACPDSELQHMREACFRAALTECTSIEECQAFDYEELGIHQEPILLNSSPNPLLHIFREIRNLEVHLRQSVLVHEPKEVLWGDITKPVEAIPIRTTIWKIDDLTPDRFSQLRNAKYYESVDIFKMVDWLNFSQGEWGIQYLLLLAIEEYCKLLTRTNLDAWPRE